MNTPGLASSARAVRVLLLDAVPMFAGALAAALDRADDIEVVSTAGSLGEGLPLAREFHPGAAGVGLPGAFGRRRRRRSDERRATLSWSLTAREREVLELLDAGLDAERIAQRLVISRNTARNHVQRVLVKLRAHSKLEAVSIARREGLLLD